MRPISLTDYQNLTIGSDVIFSGNRANQAWVPPAIAQLLTNIQYASTSIPNPMGGYFHPINNYDINFVGDEPINFSPVVGITKLTAITVMQNAALTYEITIRNTGDATLTGLEVTDINCKTLATLCTQQA